MTNDLTLKELRIKCEGYGAPCYRLATKMVVDGLDPAVGYRPIPFCDSCYLACARDFEGEDKAPRF